MKIVALIPAPAECEVQSAIKFLNAQSIVPIEIHRRLRQVYGHTRLEGQHISCRSSAGMHLTIIHPIARTSRLVISIFSYISRNYCPVSVSVFRMKGSQRRLSQWLQSLAAEFYDTGYKNLSHGMTNISIPEVNMLKYSSKLNVSLEINISIKLGFVSVNGPRGTYFVDALRMSILRGYQENFT